MGDAPAGAGIPVDVTHLAVALDAEERRLQAQADADAAHLHRAEEHRYSQGGEDGIIAEIFRRVGTTTRTFAELGSSDGSENCTRALVEAGWRGVWLEGDPDAAASARHVAADRPVEVVEAFIDRDNVRDLLAGTALPPEPDLVVVDLDGNDLWIWEAVAAAHRPRVVVLEYNSVFGPWDTWAMPYDAGHRWDGTCWFGASLAAQADVCRGLGYQLVGCDRLGVNAFYVRDDLAGAFTERSVRAHYVGPRYQLAFGHPSSVATPPGTSALVQPDELALDVALPATRTLRPGERLYFEAAVTNTAAGLIGESVERPVRIAAWWCDQSVPVAAEPARCVQPWIAEPGSTRGLVGVAVAPDRPGRFELQVGLVQEGVAWLDGAARVSGGAWTVAGRPS